MKTCAKCGATKASTEFYKNAAKADRLSSWCRVCEGAYAKGYAAEHKEELKQYRAENKRQAKYGISEGQFQAMLLAQNNCCACCRDAFVKEPHVDHNHKTGVVRALLCGPCNKGIGFLKDSALRCFLAASYVQRFEV